MFQQHAYTVKFPVILCSKERRRETQHADEFHIVTVWLRHIIAIILLSIISS